MRCPLPAVVSRVGAGTAPVKVWAALIENNTPRGYWTGGGCA